MKPNIYSDLILTANQHFSKGKLEMVLFSSNNVIPLIHQPLCHPMTIKFNCCALFAYEINTIFVRTGIVSVRQCFDLMAAPGSPFPAPRFLLRFYV